VPEPNSDAPALAAQKALYDAHFPAAPITTSDIHRDFDRLAGRGVKFLRPPRRMGSVIAAFFDDPCGNFIVTAQQSA
jgi:hypothetical protein